MDQLLTNSKPLLPGFRFHPTDQELFVYYLKRKCMGKSLSPQMMSDVDVYQFPPWDLPGKSWMKTRDLSWFFFCPRSKKYARGSRTNRSTEHGYWKSTGNDRTVKYTNRSVGKIKTLIFHLGKAPKGDRTDWVMHEYRLEDQTLADKGVSQDLYVICKVYKKSGQGPKNGENYGAPFVEEDWDTDDDDESMQTGVGIPLANECNTHTTSAITNTLPAPVTPSSGLQQVTQDYDYAQEFDIDPMGIIEGDEVEKLLAMFTEDDITIPVDETENVAQMALTSTDATENKVEHDDKDVYNGLDDLEVGFHTSQTDFSWSQLAAEIGKDCYINLEDLD